MALANKEHLKNEGAGAAMAIIQGSTFYDQDFRGPSLIQNSSHIYGVHGEPDSPEKAAKMSYSSAVSSPSSTNSCGLGYCVAEEDNSIIMFKPNFIHANAGSLLSFDQNKTMLNTKMISEEDEYPTWEGQHHLHYVNHGPPENSRSHHAPAEQWAWQEATGAQEITGQEATINKRHSTGENLQALKKQCVNKKPKHKAAADPQSVAAKNRRERISERLKTLQELVPNGSKVDLVTMLEKAISYVKFLQLQVKVLAADEFWPVQGGKAPDLSQVREAIDAILATQRDRRSSSSK